MGKASRTKRERRTKGMGREHILEPEPVSPTSWERKKFLIALFAAIITIAAEATGMISPEWAPVWWGSAAVVLFAILRADDFLSPRKDYTSAVGAIAAGFYVFVIFISVLTVTITSLDQRVRELLDTNSIRIVHAQAGGVPGNELSYYIEYRGHWDRPITIGIPKSSWDVLTIWQPAFLSPEQVAWLDSMSDFELASFRDAFQIATSTPDIDVTLRRFSPPVNDPDSGPNYLVGVSQSVPLASNKTTVINEIANVGRTGQKVESVLRQMYMNSQ